MKKIMMLAAGVTLSVGLLAQPASSVQATPPAAAKAAPTITGKWTMSSDFQGQTMTSQMELKLDGKKVTGSLTSDRMGSQPFEGEFADNKLTFWISFNVQGNTIQMTYTATLKDDKLTGSLSLPQMGEIPWTAERVKEPAAAQAPASKSTAIAGKWAMTLELPSIGTASPVLDLKQDGEKISGTYTGRYGASKVEGTLKDRAIEFVTTVDAEGTPAKMSFWGEVSADGQTMIKGTAEVDGLGSATWTAAKAKG